MRKRSWYADGLRFECQECAACCKTHGEYAYVYVTERDIKAIAAHLGLSPREFVNLHCNVDDDGWFHLSMQPIDCPLLDENGRCKAYPARPKQCATWPFWSENLIAEVWHGPVAECCPGIGRGQLYSRQEIERIARERDRWY
jgi:Fe-S-cluster containining protein